MTTARALLILSVFFGAVAAMILMIVARDDALLVQVLRGVVMWAAVPAIFLFMWTVLQPLMGRLVGITLGIWGAILTGKFNDKN